MFKLDSIVSNGTRSMRDFLATLDITYHYNGVIWYSAVNCHYIVTGDIVTVFYGFHALSGFNRIAGANVTFEMWDASVN